MLLRLSILLLLAACELPSSAPNPPSLPGESGVRPSAVVIGRGCGGRMGMPPDIIPSTTNYLGQQYCVDVIINGNCRDQSGTMQTMMVSVPFADQFVGAMPLTNSSGCFTYFKPGLTAVTKKTAASWCIEIPNDPRWIGAELMFQAVVMRADCDGTVEALTTDAIKVQFYVNPDFPEPSLIRRPTDPDGR